MSDEELRLKCLELLDLKAGITASLKDAEQIYNFITAKSSKNRAKTEGFNTAISE